MRLMGEGEGGEYSFFSKTYPSNQAFALLLPMEGNPANAQDVNQHHLCFGLTASSILTLEKYATSGTAGIFYNVSGWQQVEASFIQFYYLNSFIHSHRGNLHSMHSVLSSELDTDSTGVQQQNQSFCPNSEGYLSNAFTQFHFIRGNCPNLC